MFSVIFDMDGTLFDTQRAYVPAWDYVGEKHGFGKMGKYIPDVCGMNELCCKAYLEEHFPGIDAVKFRDDVREFMSDNLVVEYKKGAFELLEFLKAKGVKIALASGTRRVSIDHHLAEVGAHHYFDAICGGDDVINGKPAPDVFLLAAQKIGADPADCFVFEDSENGIRAGYAAGMKVIGVPDMVNFRDEVKALEFCELESLDKAIPLFEKYL